MKIVVLLKEVPDTYGERTLHRETGLAERADSENVADEICERALEAALSYHDSHPETEVTVLAMAPETAATTIRKSLAMGAASATQVVDESLLGADLGLTAEVLAAALRRSGFDLVIAGNQSTDGMGGVLPAMLAELLEVPVLSNLSAVSISDEHVAGVRSADEVTTRIRADLPAIISVTEQLPDARFPNFKGIMAAKKKPYEVLTLTDLGFDAQDLSVPRNILTSIHARPARAAGIKIVDEGNAASQLVAYLTDNRVL